LNDAQTYKEYLRMDVGTVEDALVPALFPGFAILDLIAANPGLDFTAVHSKLGLPKSSTHNLLSSLCKLGALRLQVGKTYTLGLKLAELGNFAAGERFIEAMALPLLRRLGAELYLTCHLGVREGREAVYLSKVQCDHPIKVDSWVGKRFSLHCSALGKVLLAWLPAADLDRALAEIEWRKNTDKTITNPAEMKRHLAAVRDCGWAIDDEENVPEIRCIAAPIFDRRGRVAAAVSAVGTVLQVTPGRFETLAPRLLNAAAEISRVTFGE
jgi:DNA-binding IclR family transcriptional regulator